MKKTYSISYNARNFDLDKLDSVNTLYKLFNKKMDVVSKYLFKTNIDTEEWDISFVREDARELIEQIKAKFICGQEFDWRINVNKIIQELLKRYLNNFLLIDKHTEDELDKCEQYYDLLCNMFGNTVELLDIEYIAFNKKKEYEALIVERIASLSDNIIKNNAISVKIPIYERDKAEDFVIAA